MNILFLSLEKYGSINEHDIYTDLLREFIAHDNKVFVLSAVESSKNRIIHVIREKNSVILQVPTGKIQKTNIIEKGINTLLIEIRYKQAIRRHFRKTKFDLVLYPTPPITLAGVVEYIKKRDQANTYLLLKDIFPQNAVDMEMMLKSGIRGMIYRFFRLKEKKLYAVSDYIGCMSEANVNYVIKHNPEIDRKKIEVCPNSIEIRDMRLTKEEKNNIRKKYNIPINKKVFVYGGNLGRPQGIPFLISCLNACIDKQEVYFLLVGDGTEYGKLEDFFKKKHPDNMKLMKYLPKEDYDKMVVACDVGMIFLDYRFTIPNFPSRLLSYMQAGIPVLACTDPNTDIGDVITEREFGWWCESDDTESFLKLVDNILKTDLHIWGMNGKNFLVANYSVQKSYELIMNKIK